MKIAVTSSGDSIDSPFDNEFGRCPFFIIYDTTIQKNEAVKNEGKEMPNGAGAKAAETIINKGVEVLLTKKVGGKAEEILNKGKIRIVTEYGSCETVNDVLKKYLS